MARTAAPVTLGDTRTSSRVASARGAHAEVYEAELASVASSDEDVGAYAVKVQEARYAKGSFIIARRRHERLPQRRPPRWRGRNPPRYISWAAIDGTAGTRAWARWSCRSANTERCKMS